VVDRNRLLSAAKRHQVALLAVGMTFILLTLLLWSAFGDREDPLITSIRDQGYPVTLAELDQGYSRLPDGENAALIYLKAFAGAVISGTNKSSAAILDGDWLPERGKTLSAEQMQELKSVLEDSKETLGLLHSVPDGMRSRYPVDLTQGFNALLPHLAKIKRAATLLCAESVYYATLGDQERAVEAVTAASRLANSLRNEPTLISYLVFTSAHSMALITTDRLLQKPSLSDDQLRRLERVAVRADYPAGLSHALVAERCQGLSLFTNPQEQKAFLSGNLGSSGSSSGGLRSAAISGVLKTTGIMRRDRRFYLETMAQHVNAANKPMPERFGVAPTNAVPHKLYIFSRMLLPSLSNLYAKSGDVMARASSLRTAIAVERYRLAAGALPESLGQLVPRYLPEIPIDPFTGKPLKYERREPGYVVYSLGSNRVDDGGPPLVVVKRSSGKPTDVGTCVGR
jgi:hypothetical protein